MIRRSVLLNTQIGLSEVYRNNGLCHWQCRSSCCLKQGVPAPLIAFFGRTADSNFTDDLQASTMSSLDGTPVSVEVHEIEAIVKQDFGVLLICGVVTVGLLGITTLQAWFYLRTYPGDNKLVKATVATVWCIEFLRSSFVVHACYYYVVLNWGNVGVLDSAIWTIRCLPFLTSIVEIIVQMYFAWKIWTVGRGTVFGRVLTTMVIVLSLCTLGPGLAVDLIGLKSVTWSSYEVGAPKILTTVVLSLSTAANVAIMLSLTFLLYRSRTGLRGTNHLINSMIFYTIEAGALIVIIAAIVIVLEVYISRVGLAYVGVYAFMGNLYANSILSSLNARVSLRARVSPVVTASSHGTWRSALSSALSQARKGQAQADGIVDHGGITGPTDSYELHMISHPTAQSRVAEDLTKPATFKLDQVECAIDSD